MATAACKRLTRGPADASRNTARSSRPAQTLQIERMRYNAYTLEQRLVGRLLVGPAVRATCGCTC